MIATPLRRRLTTVLVTAIAVVSTASTATSAAPPPADPVFDTDAHPSFGWSVPERYDASWAAYRSSSGSYRPDFVSPSTWSILLDACDSTAVRRITGYVFTISRVGTAM